VKEHVKRVPGLVPVVHIARAVHRKVQRGGEDARFVLDGRLRRDRRIDEYLRTNNPCLLQLGTGSNPYEGWLNTDVADYRRRREVIYLDARKPFPLPTGSFDAVFSEHMLEHLTYQEGQSCLRESYRVLREGGRLRVATPSARQLTRLYRDDLSDLQRRYMDWSVSVFVDHAEAPLPGFVVNNMFYNFGHRFVYDDETLRLALETVGFRDVQQWPVGESDEPALRNLERHMRSAAEFNAYETLILEARKPEA
jgi:predicted SAM-dependent methyltransferase